MSDLTELALRAKDGDVKALHQLLQHPDFRQRVKIICRKMYSVYPTAGRYRDAEDLEQNIYERMLKKMSEFRGRASILTWVDRMARNIRISQIRREIRGESGAEKSDWADRQESVQESQARRLSLKQAIDKLPRRQQDILQLSTEGLKLEAIAQRVFMSKSQVHRELKEIQEKMVESIEGFD